MVYEYLNGDFDAIVKKLIVVGLFWSFVILAIAVDFYFGVKKARQIGEARKSEGYRRTVEKFNHYFGMLIYALIFDSIIPAAYFFDAPIAIFPFITLIATVVLVFTEAKSVQEKADDKQRRKVQHSFNQLLEILEKREDLVSQILETIKKQNNENENYIDDSAPTHDELQDEN